MQGGTDEELVKPNRGQAVCKRGVSTSAELGHEGEERNSGNGEKSGEPVLVRMNELQKQRPHEVELLLNCQRPGM